MAQAADVDLRDGDRLGGARGCADGPDGFIAGLGAGKTIIDMSTVSPVVSRETVEKVRARSSDMVDSPVSGSISTLEQGKLTMMVGGKAETFEKVKPLLLEIGMKATHVGDNGLALSMKIALNLAITTQMLAFSEGILLAEKAGIDRKTAVEVLHQQRAGLAADSIPRALRAQHAGGGLVRHEDDAEGHDAGPRTGPRSASRCRPPAVANEMLTAARGLASRRRTAPPCST